MKKLITIGHKNPDTDSVVASIVGAKYFKNVLGFSSKENRAGELNSETKFVLQKFGFSIPELISEISDEESVAIFDHNEEGQMSEKISPAKISHVIDHHKISLKTDSPIFCRVEPIGSTSSIIAKMFFEKNEKIQEAEAALLLAGILSDTLNFTSPTTTEEDREIASRLNQITKINLDTFATEMFEAKSNLDGISIKEIISLDYKNFEMGKYKVGIGAFETTNPNSVNEKKAEIILELRQEKEKEKLDYIFFMSVDILKQNSYLYIIADKEKELATKVFGGSVENEMMFLKNVVSRKKQIVPQLTEELTK